MKEKIENIWLRGKTSTAEEAAASISDNMTVAIGGYTSYGYPKKTIKELAKRSEKGEDFKIKVISGANDGPVDTILADAKTISRRIPMLESKSLAEQVNSGQVEYVEQQMSKMPRLLASGKLGNIDVAIVEAIRITEEGFIVPTASVGLLPRLIESAKRVIVEINTGQPEAFDGMHDIWMPEKYPRRTPIPLLEPGQHIGEPFVRVDPAKISHIVESDELDKPAQRGAVKPEMAVIADNLVGFLETEMERVEGKILPPIQTGFGALATAVVEKLGKSDFKNITFFGGGLQEANMDLIASGKAAMASTGSIQMSPHVVEMLNDEPDYFRKHVVIHNSEVTNSNEITERLGVIALMSGIEVDIYGNVNSSHIAGAKVVNGIGGGANFAQNAGLTVMMITSTGKKGDISTIVPLVSHVDVSEHDVDVLITENGVADLRGLSDRERAKQIIKRCVSHEYKSALEDYYERAEKLGGHHPIILEESLSWHSRLKETGSMKQKI